jgi:aminopeptidase N
MLRRSGCGQRLRRMVWCAAALAVAAAVPTASLADEPYARSRDYSLENVRTHLWFDLDQHKVRGEVVESVSVLRDGISQLKFDSVDLKIQGVTVDGKSAKFATTPNELVVSLERAATRGERHGVFIRYEGQPKRGLYFILPDKNYPDRPKEIWTQGEAEDTRYYIPIYDYPNDRTTSEMLLTVPASWLTISNGKLVSVRNDAGGMKTWNWKQSEPISTYLITVVAGEFVEKEESWRGIPLRYVVPRGEEQKVDATFARTKQMVDLFSDKLGVRYPWDQYAQSSVDEFVEGGMENTSATTLTASALVNPKLASEDLEGADSLDSHELAHQWFGDLVTCKDWADLWLNEGFATYFEHFWTSQRYGTDDADYDFWRDQRRWFSQRHIYAAPIVNRTTEDPLEYAGNIYTKGGWVLRMLQEKLGDADFFRGLHNYLETYRGQNVVTADLQKSIEQATATNVDEFFSQWVYRAGAPEFAVTYTYDDAAHQVNLEVKQTQRAEGFVGVFNVPIEVEIATAGNKKTYPIEVRKAYETFSLPADHEPLMVIFDKGDKILKSVDFKKETAALIYQLKHAETVPDRADAAVALGDVKDHPEAIAALGDAAQRDPFWGIRVEALRALGKIGGPDAGKQILEAAEDDKPWVRDVSVEQLGHFKDDPSLAPKLMEIAAKDKAYRVRAAAIRSLATIKAPNAYDMLVAAVKSDSPDDILREAGLRGLGTLDDDKAVSTLLEWTKPGKPLGSRGAAISAVAGLDKKNKDITKTLISYLREPYSEVKFASLFALGGRGDPDAIGPLEEFLKSGDLNPGMAPLLQGQISALKAQAGGKADAAGPSRPHRGEEAESPGAPEASDHVAEMEAMKNLQREIEEVNRRLAKIESQLATSKK